MRSKVKRHNLKDLIPLPVLRLYLLLFIFAPSATAQTVAVLTPDKAETSKSFVAKLAENLNKNLKVLDYALSEAAYLSVSPADAFNLTTGESHRIGSAIGCDFFILVRSAVQRRSAFRRAEYYESYAALYVVSSRTGRLILWKLQRFEADRPHTAVKMLNDSALPLADEIESGLRAALQKEIAESGPPVIEEVPDENSPASKNFRPPIPYRRIKPEYPAIASFFDIAATVDILVDTDSAGSIIRTEIVRWAGFGLDESVETTVRLMNWRPAERNGKALPMRFLLRYNFRKIDKE